MPMAAQMLDLKERLKGELAGPAALRGTIRFGISELGALTWLPRFVTRVRAEHPQVILQPHVDLSRRLERQVARGELDFAAVTGPPDPYRPRWTVHIGPAGRVIVPRRPAAAPGRGSR